MMLGDTPSGGVQELEKGVSQWFEPGKLEEVTETQPSGSMPMRTRDRASSASSDFRGEAQHRRMRSLATPDRPGGLTLKQRTTIRHAITYALSLPRPSCCSPCSSSIRCSVP